MLRCEAQVPRQRCQLARRIAPWSLGGLVVLAALVDATVLAPRPVPDAANVEIDEAQAMKAETEARLAAMVEASWPAETSVSRAPSRLTLELPRYELNHGPATTEMAIELVAPCERGVVTLEGQRLPRVTVLTDGTYVLDVTCPTRDAAMSTTLVVAPR